MFSSRCRLVLSLGMLACSVIGIQAADVDKQRLDAYGDPLPTEVLLRLGPARFRCDVSTGSALSPDGKTLAVTTREAVLLLDPVSGKERKRIAMEEEISSGAPVYSPDGKTLAVVVTKSVHFYDTSSTKLLGKIDVDILYGSVSIGFSPDGKRVALGASGAARTKLNASVWDVAEFKKLHDLAVEQDIEVRAQFSGDGRVVATWGNGSRTAAPGAARGEVARVVQMWDATTGKETNKIQVDGTGIVTVSLSPDGKQLAIVESTDESPTTRLATTRGEMWLETGSTVSVWEVASGKKLQRLATRQGVGFLRYSPDGKQFVTVTADGVLQTWEAATGKRLTSTQGPTGFISVAFRPENKLLVSAVDDHAVHVWEAPSGRVLSLKEGHNSQVRSTCFTTDGKTVLSSAADGVRFWDTKTGKTVRQMTVRDDGERLTSRTSRLLIAISPSSSLLSPDGRYLAAESVSRGRLRLIDTATEEEAFAVDSTTALRSQAAAFSADGAVMAVVSGSGSRLAARGETLTVRLLQTASGREIGQWKIDNATRVMLAVSPDGKQVVAAIYGRAAAAVGVDSKYELKAWDQTTGKEIWTKTNTDGTAEALYYSPTGELVATVGTAGIHLLDPATGIEFLTLEKPETVVSTMMQFSRDGRTLATTSGNRKSGASTVVLWEIATGKRRVEYEGPHSSGVANPLSLTGRALRALAFSPNGQVLAAGAGDTTVLLWDLTGQLYPAVRDAAKPATTEFDALWKELADADAEKAYRLIQRLAAYPAEATALIKANLPAVKAKKMDTAEIARLIADLDHNEFEQREKASKALAALGKPVSAALTKALQSEPSAEKKRRLIELLDALKTKGPTPEMVRPTRALEVLERIGTAEAKQVVEELAKGDPYAKLTEDARATLKRLAARE
jgi:WD40 repeat protein